MKRTALAAFPRCEVASLYGEQWVGFLCRTTDQDPVVRETAGQLALAAYQANVEPRRVIEGARRWIEKHHA